MSKDKHRGRDRRNFALANLPAIDRGRRKIAPTPISDQDALCGYSKRRRDRRWVNISKEIRQLEKEGKVARRRVGAWSAFGPHIKRTRLVVVDTTSKHH